jgi:hypothetical protein
MMQICTWVCLQYQRDRMMQEQRHILHVALKTKNKQIYQIVSQTLQAFLVICRLGNILHDALKDEDADLCFQFNVMEHNERRKFTINTSQRRHSLTSRT